MVNWEEKYNEARKLADKINVLNGIYDKVVDSMHWDCMEYHPSDDEHETTWLQTTKKMIGSMKMQVSRKRYMRKFLQQ